MSSVNQRAARRWATERNRRAQLLNDMVTDLVNGWWQAFGMAPPFNVQQQVDEILVPLYIRGTEHFDPAYAPEAQFPRWQVKP